uniref:Uncharacterized protein n=1 Tax=Salix viminalis TaxID=40686 RepID=A0A6N2LU56_SALVM
MIFVLFLTNRKKTHFFKAKETIKSGFHTELKVFSCCSSLSNQYQCFPRIFSQTKNFPHKDLPIQAKQGTGKEDRDFEKT